MAIDELEYKETNLNELIEIVEKDAIPTNEFTIQDVDKYVLLGKLNEIEQHLRGISELVGNSDSKANNALEQAIKAVQSATTALDSSNTALDSSNTALATANQAIETANNALQNVVISIDTSNEAKEIAQNALNIINEANTKADNAVSVANSANTTANEAKEIASGANTTANNAKNIADEALSQVVSGAGTKVYEGGTLQSTFDADTKANQSDLNTTNANVATNTSDIATLKTSKANQSDLNTTNSNVATNTSDIATLKTSKANQTALDELQESTTNAVQTLDERVNGKADANANNIAGINKTLWQKALQTNNMPSAEYEDLTATNNKTYTATTDGWFAWVCTTTSSSFANITLKNQTTGIWFRASETATSAGVFGIMPVKAGDTVLLTYSNITFTGNTDRYFRFYFAEGAI